MTQATQPQWPPSYRIVGGVIGDLAIAGAANGLGGQVVGGDAEFENHFAVIAATLLGVDIVGAITVYLLQHRR